MCRRGCQWRVRSRSQCRTGRPRMETGLHRRRHTGGQSRSGQLHCAPRTTASRTAHSLPVVEPCQATSAVQRHAVGAGSSSGGVGDAAVNDGVAAGGGRAAAGHAAGGGRVCLVGVRGRCTVSAGQRGKSSVSTRQAAGSRLNMATALHDKRTLTTTID